MRFHKATKPVNTLHTQYIIIKLIIRLDCFTYCIFSGEGKYVPPPDCSVELDGKTKLSLSRLSLKCQKYPVRVMHEIIDCHVSKTHIAEATASSFI